MNPTPKSRQTSNFSLQPLAFLHLSAVALLVCGGGCSTPVDIQGDYQTAGQTISAGFDATTNGLILSGQVSNTNQAVGGAVTVGK